jgi:hypothetical protein
VLDFGLDGFGEVVVNLCESVVDHVDKALCHILDMSLVIDERL